MSNNNTHSSSPESWVDNYGDYLYGYAFTRLRDKRAAEDMMQDTFLAALKSRQSFKGKSSEKTWLVGILKNKIIDQFRKTQREVNIDDISNFESNDNIDFIPSGKNAGAWLIDKRPSDWLIDSSDPAELAEFWKFLNMCLSQAPKNIANIFILREIEGLENEEICNKIDINPTNLRVILYRARKELRRCLENNWINKE